MAVTYPRGVPSSSPLDRGPTGEHTGDDKWARIISIMAQRRMSDNALLRRMVVIRDHNNNDVTIPLPDIAEEPTMNMLIPSLVHDGIEGIALQCNGPQANIHCPALDLTKEDGPGSRVYAGIRRRALYGRWHESRLPILLGRAYRQLCGYGSMALVGVPDFVNGGVRYEFRDALTAYPEPRAAEDIRPPANVGFVYGRSADWILANYPEAAPLISQDLPRGGMNNQAVGQGLWDMVEWIDAEHVIVGILGPRNLYATSVARPIDIAIHASSGIELRRWPNLAGVCTAVVPRRVTLDRIAGQLDNIVPVVDWMARFMAMDVLAAEKHIYPDMVALAEPSMEPRIVSGNGQWQDGRTGDINLIAGVRDVKYLTGQPGASTERLLQNLERSARLSGGVSQLYGGDTTGMGGNPRTGRAIDTVGSFSIDPRVQELQQIMSYCLTDLNTIGMELECGYFPKRKMVVFTGFAADESEVEYTPNVHFETKRNVVSYTFPGTDLSQITVGIAQLTGAELMSKRTARDKHPFIEDPYQEEQMIALEALDAAMRMQVQSQVANGQMSLEALAKMRIEIEGGTPQAQAILVVSEEEQKKQAAAAQAAQQAAAQAQAGQQPPPPGPEGMPGLSPGANAAALANGPQPPAPQPERNLADLVKTIAAPARSTYVTPH